MPDADVERVLSFFEARLRAQEERHRDYDKEFGYPLTSDLTPEFLRNTYDRGGLLSSFVVARPEETWSGRNDVLLDGQATDELQMLARRHRLWETSFRADLMSEVTGFSCVLVPGLDLTTAPLAEEFQAGGFSVSVQRPSR